MAHNRGLKRALLLIAGATVLLIVGLLVARPWTMPVVGPDEGGDTQSAQSEDQEPQSSFEVEEAPKEPTEFTISAGGDMLIHMPVADSAWDGQRWDFGRLWQPIWPYLQGSDIALCNMETAMIPPEQAPTGFPIFGTPRDLAVSMGETGWDGCSTSSNHSLDQGFSGVVNTIDYLEAAGLGHVGTARTAQEAEQPQFYLIENEADNGGEPVLVAHIAAAHNTNGLPIPQDQPWSIQMIDVPVLEERARQARADGADVVVATLHCCEIEYDTNPEAFQIETASELAASGLVDIYISHHAHVPRPIALLEGGPHGNGMWVAYGLGNFISNQNGGNTGSTESATGIMAFFHGVKEDGAPAQITSANWMAVTVDAGHMVRPLIGGVAEGAVLGGDELAYRYSLVQAIMEGSPASEIDTIPLREHRTTTVVPRS